MNKAELKQNIEKLATEENKTEVEIISELQAGAAKMGQEEVLEALCELKWDYIG